MVVLYKMVVLYNMEYGRVLQSLQYGRAVPTSVSDYKALGFALQFIPLSTPLLVWYVT